MREWDCALPPLRHKLPDKWYKMCIRDRWDAYLQELENMRLGEMMKIVQAAQTRFEENMK